jgi:RNA polymerase sigma-70 factor, ECF subfamily
MSLDLPMDARTAPRRQYPTEAEQVSAARDGDQAAFAMLYQDHVGRVHALCQRLLGDRGLAEEVTQECFLKAWRQLHGFREEARFATWMHRLAVNTVVSYQRRHGTWLGWRRQDSDAAEVADPASPADRLDLDAAIARLPARARQVFVLVDVEGYSHEQAADTLNIAIGTSKAQLHRARALLREMLS